MINDINLKKFDYFHFMFWISEKGSTYDGFITYTVFQYNDYFWNIMLDGFN